MAYDSSKPFDPLINNPNLPEYDYDPAQEATKGHTFLQGILGIKESLAPGQKETLGHLLGRKTGNIGSILSNLIPLISQIKNLRNVTLPNLDRKEVPFPMTLGEAKNDIVLMSDEARLARERKTAERVSEFKKYQSSEVENYLNTYFNRIDTADAGQRAVAAWQKLRNGMETSHKAIAKSQFDDVTAIIGNRPIFDMKPLALKYEELAKTYYKANTEVGNRLGDQLMKEYHNLTTPVMNSQGQQIGIAYKKMDADAFQNRLHLIGRDLPNEVGLDKAVKGELYDTSLDIMKKLAQQKGNEGDAAVALNKARTEFKSRLDNINDFDEKVLNRYMLQDGKRIEEPEKVMERLSKLQPTERSTFYQIANQTDPKLIYDLRNYQWQKMVDTAKVPGAASKEPGFDIRKFLTNYDKNADNLLELIPNSKERERFLSNIERMRAIANNATVAEKTDNAAIQAGAAAGGKAGGLGMYILAKKGMERLLNESPEKAFERLIMAKPNESFWTSKPVQTVAGAIVGAKALEGAQTLEQGKPDGGVPAILNKDAVGGSSEPQPVPKLMAPGESEDTATPPQKYPLDSNEPALPNIFETGQEVEKLPNIFEKSSSSSIPKMEMPDTTITPQQALDNIKELQVEIRMAKDPKVINTLKQELIKNQGIAKGYQEFE